MTVHEIGPLAYNWRKLGIGGDGMARIARVVVPGLPHHVTQCGNRREPVFFGPEDYRLYHGLIATAQVAPMRRSGLIA